MATEIIMPKLGLTMTEGTVDEWLKNEGDSISKGDIVCSISSEKLTHDVEAPVDGVLIKIVVPAGDEVECQAPIGYIGEAGEAIDGQDTNSSVVNEAAEPLPETVAIAEAATAESLASAVTAPVTNHSEGTRIFITPLARKMAKENGYDISAISGTGGNGRITRRDVERYQPVANATQTSEVSSVQAAASFGAGLSGMRKTIAERMMTSIQTTAQVTIHQKADLTKLLIFKKELKAKADLPLADGQTSITTLLSRAVILALKETPAMNAWYKDGSYEKKEAVHLGMAVAVADGLVVPVVEDADRKTLTNLAKSLNQRISQARAGTLAGKHYTGSTFTISNLGKSGVEYFTPIINSPEIGILGVGSLQKELAFDENREIIEISKLPLSLTFDHQIIDGSPAAEFLGKVIFYLEHPYSLIL
ncbi:MULTISPECIES: dihydrolipoamide acetyltransferase family protein [unclassified Enterococcus]|uniref:dihydrolipoamide acetyltransferase family protein n=1 Tax=unclassified Enterococcus TaxID=2608891 RepID=UPI001551FEE3|nr:MULTISPECIES: dihydrolipoamide acetyltransferase family protein [unclassified Enterococcus]MBS7577441.1 2-oxo acid dehydrogenase subunit E2 [Enterococcus sp. MMGLQ5-2]MBS7584848.1 2-oxo acid dehydrogenase subunit E2 [Enterococcus sp. MMGLQ5-1]NPD12703.1 2-oxo acid dehydrogenase subunit E2 [Enterococcus sp. MMGLQ5-1]NPD37275.1 2-oxo acid dehydrogenase subunit E2 [Enterococcus sp. MMGLQ5-2]